MIMKFRTAEKVLNSVVSIAAEDIVPNPAQPRLYFNDYELTQLAVSIQQNGILQPITVRKLDAGKYELIAGERRLRAAKLVNLEFVPCIVLESSDCASAILAILENLQRSDLNFLEEANSIRRLIEHYGLTQEQAAARLGVAQSTVANKLRLLRLSDRHKELVLRYGLNERQARAVLRLPEERREAALDDIYIKQLNTQQTDRLIDELLKAAEKKPKTTISMRTTAQQMLGLYLNSFNRTVKDMKNAGISCSMTQNKTSDFIEYKLTIPLK